MSKALVVFFTGCALAAAQTPNLTGSWRADLKQSKLPGPPLKDYAEIIQTSGKTTTEQIGEVAPWGEQRSELVYTTEKPTIRPYEGVPSRETAKAEGMALTVTIETDGRAAVTTRNYEISPDSKTLTITSDTTGTPHAQHSVVVLNRVPDSDIQWLRQPEPTAGEHYKNVKTVLKTLTTSQFADQMHYISWALDKDCEFCHVRGHFDSDDKKEKRTARQMIEMVSGVDEKYFEAKPEVKCFTCHEFHAHPLSRPLFLGEPEHHHGPGEGGERSAENHAGSDRDAK